MSKLVLFFKLSLPERSPLNRLLTFTTVKRAINFADAFCDVLYIHLNKLLSKASF